MVRDLSSMVGKATFSYQETRRYLLSHKMGFGGLLSR